MFFTKYFHAYIVPSMIVKDVTLKNNLRYKEHKSNVLYKKIACMHCPFNDCQRCHTKQFI